MSLDEIPFSHGHLNPPHWKLLSLPKGLLTVNAITVNTTSGTAERISKLENLFDPDIESMEGAAFYFCCMHMHLPCFQLRSISNYVEKRNKANWNIPLAVEQLNIALQKIISNSIL